MKSPYALVLGLLALAPAALADADVAPELIPAVQAMSPTESLRESELAYRVEATVADLPGLHCGAVHAHVVRGVVTLLGDVPNLQTHDRLVVAVHSVEGVRVVRDETTLAPAGTPLAVGGGGDPGARVAAVLESYHQADGQPLAVRWDGGRVLLSGRVANWAEARHALSAARAAVRTQQIHSEITVASAEFRR